MPKLTIVVPVFNAEHYLTECLDSIESQTYSDWELLLIDDGSLDHSIDICERYSKIDSRIKLFRKVNGGVSSARNMGLDNASGTWVTFIDADDHISPSFFENLLRPTCSDSDLDFVHGGCTSWTGTQPGDIIQEYHEFCGNDPKILFDQFRGLIPSKLFRLEFINQWIGGHPLRFDEQMAIAEDMAFTLDYMLMVHKYAFVSEVGYYYRKDNIQSATKQIFHRCYPKELLSYRHLLSSASCFVEHFGINIDDYPQRLARRGGQLFRVCVTLYEDESVYDKYHHLTGDFSREDFKVLKYYSGNTFGLVMSSLLFHGFRFLFHLVMVLMYLPFHRKKHS